MAWGRALARHSVGCIPIHREFPPGGSAVINLIALLVRERLGVQHREARVNRPIRPA